MNKLQVIGNLGADATVQNVNGATVINFAVADTERWKDKQGNQQEKTTWFSIAYWTEKVNVANYLKKGTQVYVEGKAEPRIYTNKQGQDVPQVLLRATNIILLGSSKKDSNEQPAPTQPQSQQPQIQEPLEDLPF